MEWSGYEVVLGVSLGDSTVGVVRMPDGNLLFPGRVDVRGGVVLTTFEPHATTVDGRTVVAGRCMPGVARVVVIDDRGDDYEATVADEVWVAVAGEAEFSEPLARFEDASGALVPLTLPDGERTPVEDADAPCPVCGEVAWVEIDERVHCERCGLEVGAGLHFVYATEVVVFDEDSDIDDDNDFDEDGWQAQYEREQAEALAAASFPIYGVPGHDPQIGYSSGSDGVDEVTLHYADGDRQLEVESAVGEQWGRDRLRESLAGMLAVHDWGYDGSDAARRVHTAGAMRAARRRAALADREIRELVIDGEPEPFAFVGVDQVWVASRDHFGVTVRLSGVGFDPATVALEPLTSLGGFGSTADKARRAATGELLSRDEVAELIDEHQLGEFRDKILAAIRPGYRLQPDTRSPHRIGGLPDLAPDEQWPHDENGIPYTFVAQIDCSALPPLVSEFEAPAWGHGGQLLRIFAALDARVPEGGPAVALACAPEAPLTRTEVPPRPDPVDAFEPDDDSLRRLDEQPVRPTPFLTCRQGWYVVGERHYELRYDELAQRIEAGGAKPRRDAWAEPQLLGHATNEQGEDPVPAGTWRYEDTTDDDWCTLFNLPRHPGMSFGDGGSLAILIRLKDLAAGRYDRLATDQSMG